MKPIDAYRLSRVVWIESARAANTLDPDSLKPFTDPNELVSLPVLAKRCELDKAQQDRLRKRLDTWRKNNFDAWIEDREAKRHDPRYFYPIGKVWPLAETVKSSG